jgi:methionyl-tRNA formyltransferase
MVARPSLRIVFFGTPAFAVPTLDALLASRHPVVGVVTQPDRPRERGHRISEVPVKLRALAAGVPVLQPDRLKDASFLAALEALGADLGIVAAYGRILTDTVLAMPRLGLFNVHASLLPRYRGAAPIHRAIIAGERETGVTIMRVVKALDAGPILAARPRPIGFDETSDDVERSLADLGASLLVAIVDALAAGPVAEVAQDEAAASYAPRLSREDGVVDWAREATEIHDLVRGLHPWPHAFTFFAGRRYILRRTDPCDEPAGAPPGALVEAAGDRFRVATGKGVLGVIEIQAEGKRPMSAREFLAGHRFAVGARFTSTP